MPLLTGTDGERKMSKSLGNYIGVTEPPDEMYGKTLSIPDASLETWYGLLLGARCPSESRSARRQARARARARRAFPRRRGGAEAEEAFDRVHVRHEAPEEVPEVDFRVGQGRRASAGAARQAFGVSTSEARRALAQGGVRIDGEPVPATRSISRPPRSTAGCCSSASGGLHASTCAERRGLALSSAPFVRDPATLLCSRGAGVLSFSGEVCCQAGNWLYSSVLCREPARLSAHPLRRNPFLRGATVFENSTACAPRPAHGRVCVQVRRRRRRSQVGRGDGAKIDPSCVPELPCVLGAPGRPASAVGRGGKGLFHQRRGPGFRPSGETRQRS